MQDHDRSSFLKSERHAILVLGGVLFFRMFGLFVILPVFSLYALNLKSATPTLVGFGFGAYALTQAFFQIPFGYLSDRYGRKPFLLLGLFLFGAGCFVSGLSDNIYTMILGRLLQGVGALSSVLMASVGDKIRPQLQTRAMAFMGIAVGLSFAIAFTSSSFLASTLGLSGIFLLLAGISLALIIGLSFYSFQGRAPQGYYVKGAWFKLDLSRLSLTLFCNFTVSFGLSLFMYNLPLALESMRILRESFWKYYVPLLIIGALVMLLASFIAEKYRKFKAVLLSGLAFLILSALIGAAANYFSNSGLTPYLVLGAVYVFFFGFNIFEPLLPSLTIKISGKDQRGVASGVLNFFQFLGNFCGALLAGFFYQTLPMIPFLILGFSSLLGVALVQKKSALLAKIS